MTVESMRGRLLVATPDLQDPNFVRTVVLVLEHNDDGALGVVLNRPSDTSVLEVFPEWADRADAPAVAFVGGPVARESVIALARADRTDEGEGWVPLAGGLGTVDLGRDPTALPVALDALRVFAGYAGWAPGQLDGEVEAGGWFVVDAEPADPFGDRPQELWATVLRRQRGKLAWFANCPLDPATN